MNSFIPNNEVSEASPLTLPASAVTTADGSIVTPNMTSVGRSNSPSEYKVFNNNESRENAEVKVRPSPDSGLAEVMSNSGSPAGAHAGHHLQPQGSPIPGRTSNGLSINFD